MDRHPFLPLTLCFQEIRPPLFVYRKRPQAQSIIGQEFGEMHRVGRCLLFVKMCCNHCDVMLINVYLFSAPQTVCTRDTADFRWMLPATFPFVRLTWSEHILFEKTSTFIPASWARSCTIASSSRYWTPKNYIVGSFEFEWSMICTAHWKTQWNYYVITLLCTSKSSITSFEWSAL